MLHNSIIGLGCTWNIDWTHVPFKGCKGARDSVTGFGFKDYWQKGRPNPSQLHSISKGPGTQYLKVSDTQTTVTGAISGIRNLKNCFFGRPCQEYSTLNRAPFSGFMSVLRSRAPSCRQRRSWQMAAGGGHGASYLG